MLDIATSLPYKEKPVLINKIYGLGRRDYLSTQNLFSTNLSDSEDRYRQEL
jgi:hypothetical protein